MTNKLKIGKKEPLVKNLLLVEGISRAGKFLLANILSGFKDIEPVQYHGLLEHLPILEKFGFIDKKLAETILRHEIDFRAYEMLIGRNFNHRLSDKSSIFNHPRHKEYLQRCREEDTGSLLKKYSSKNIYSQFMTHELMPNIQIYFDAFPNMKVISLKRNPVDLVWSWYQRGLTRRFIKDPTLFMFPFESGGRPTHWFVRNHKNDYHSLKEMDKVIFSISNLFNMYESAYRYLHSKYKKNILFVHFEDLLSQPDKTVKRISHFLGKKITPEMKLIFKRENLPNKKYFISREEKMPKIKRLSSRKYFKKLEALEIKYQRELS